MVVVILHLNHLARYNNENKTVNLSIILQARNWSQIGGEEFRHTNTHLRISNACNYHVVAVASLQLVLHEGSNCCYADSINGCVYAVL